KLAPIANRPAQPAPRQPAPHRCRAAVYDAGERELRAAAEARLDLEVAPRRDVHDQRVVAPLAREALQMRHLRALRVLHVLHEAARGADRFRRVLRVVAGKVADMELLAEQPPPRVLVGMPRRAGP